MLRASLDIYEPMDYFVLVRLEKDNLGKCVLKYKLCAVYLLLLSFTQFTLTVVFFILPPSAAHSIVTSLVP